MSSERCKDLSVIITVHDEGLLLHKTLLSVFRALVKLEEEKYTYEIIIHVDNGDEVTKKYLERYKDDKRIKIFYNSFGDTGPSRNFAAEKSCGECIAFLDGDDLISDNWYLNALKMIEQSNEEILVHPEAVLAFGNGDNVLTIQKDSNDLYDDVLLLVGENPWTSVILTKKKTFEKIKYIKLEQGYGHEDYVFNIKAVENKIKHKIAKETVLFYRRSNNSRLSMSEQENLIIPYMSLFSVDNLEKINLENTEETKIETLKQKSYRFYKNVRNNDFLNFFITPVAKMMLRVMNRQSTTRKDMPNFVFNEWKKINAIETQLYPYEYNKKNLKKYTAENYLMVGKIFCKIMRNVKRKIDYVFIVPWMNRGGADKVVLNYIKALKENHPNWHFAVITTLPADNTWKDKMPDYVEFMDFGNMADGLVPEMRDKLFSLLITQLNCGRLHIVNSEYGYSWAKRHQKLIKYHYRLNVSLFCAEFIPGSNLEGVFSYDDPYLFDIYESVNKVFTDNKTMIEKTIRHNGYYDNKITVHYQPIENMEIQKTKDGLVENGKIRILWAGRITNTKMPEMVAEIGKRLDGEKFQIDVYGSKSGDVKDDVFDGSLCVKYMGEFDGFASLPTDKYDLFLYTSLDDGVPNVILEATAAGLPVVASNDGGVGEFIVNEKTGYLIEDYLKSDEYVNVLKGIYENPKAMFGYVKNAQKLLKERHNMEVFTEKVGKDIE